MRTIKYELSHPDSGVTRKVAEAVHGDYLRMYGLTDLDEYLAHDGQQPPNLIDYWLEALALGGVFAYDSEALNGMVNNIRGAKNLQEQLFEAMEPQLQEVFDKAQWIGFFTKEKRAMDEKGRDQIQQQFLSKLKKPDQADEPLRTMAERYADGIGEVTYGEEQIRFACDIFGIDYDGIKQQSGATGEEPSEKLTFLFLPEMNPVDTTGWSRTQVFERVESRLQDLLGDDARAKQALGIGSNGNAMSHFFGASMGRLRENDLQPLLQSMRAVAGYSAEDEEAVRPRLERLAELAREIGEPDVTNHWGDYRSDFNGKLESFASNRSRHKRDLDQQLADLQPELEQVTEMIGEVALEDKASRELQDVLKQICRFCEQARQLRLGNDDYALLPVLIGDARTQLNYWVQEYQERLKPHVKTKKGKPVTSKDVAPKLSKELQRVSLFFGDSKLIKFHKTKYAKQIFQQQGAILADALGQLLAAADVGAQVDVRHVEGFRRFADKATSDWGKSMVELLERALGVNTLRLDERERFYLSGFERGKFRQVSYAPVAVQSVVDAADWQKQWQKVAGDVENYEQLLEAIELYKTLIALLAAAGPEDSSFRIEGHELNDLQRAFLGSVDGDGLNAAQLNRFIQTMVAAELRGLVAVLSRKGFIARSALQAINGQHSELVVSGGEEQDGEFVASDQEQFMMAFPNIGIDGDWSHADWVFDKSTDAARVKFSSVRKTAGPLLNIRSSKYQLQFLRWFLRRPKTKHCDLSMQGSFTIAERNVAIDWSGEHPVCSTENTRLFASIPFTLVPPEEKAPATRTEAERYLGVDIGEYGLAWSVIEVDSKRVSRLRQGMIQHPQHLKLKTAVSGLKNQQRRGTFGMPSTYIERLRESLIGTYRNQLHALALQYGATLVFEYSVSAFETGSNRINKVYDSVKRSDAWSNRTDETRALHRQAWGERTGKGFKTGQEVSAAGTSQTCTKCRRWVGRELPEGVWRASASFDMQPVTGFDNIYEVPDLGVKVFSRQGQTITGNKLRSAIDSFTRPPEDSDARRFVKASGFAVKADRGNSAVFVCPFSDCHFVTDADIQAAFTIALRGHISTHYEGMRSKDQTVPYYELAQQEYDFEPVEV